MSRTINVTYWAKPIPDRRFDYEATYDDYEGGDGYDEQPGPVGHGRTAAEAVLDLIDTAPRGLVCDCAHAALSAALRLQDREERAALERMERNLEHRELGK